MSNLIEKIENKFASLNAKLDLCRQNLELNTSTDFLANIDFSFKADYQTKKINKTRHNVLNELKEFESAAFKIDRINYKHELKYLKQKVDLELYLSEAGFFNNLIGSYSIQNNLSSFKKFRYFDFFNQLRLVNTHEKTNVLQAAKYAIRQLNPNKFLLYNSSGLILVTEKFQTLKKINIKFNNYSRDRYLNRADLLNSKLVCILSNNRNSQAAINTSYIYIFDLDLNLLAKRAFKFEPHLISSVIFDTNLLHFYSTKLKVYQSFDYNLQLVETNRVLNKITTRPGDLIGITNQRVVKLNVNPTDANTNVFLLIFCRETGEYIKTLPLIDDKRSCLRKSTRVDFSHSDSNIYLCRNLDGATLIICYDLNGNVQFERRIVIEGIDEHGNRLQDQEFDLQFPDESSIDFLNCFKVHVASM
jgi:hypothetical protein